MAASNSSPKGLTVFFGLFLLGGAAMSLAFIVPAIRVFLARDWIEVPCTIVASSVKESSGNHGTTYSVSVAFTYTIAGQARTSDRYSLLRVSSSGRDAKDAVVASLPPGKHTTCFVNPKSPDQAVLVRSLTSEYFFGLIPLVFVAVGAIGIVAVRRTARRATAPPPPPDAPLSATPPFRRALGLQLAFFALFLIVGAALTYFLFLPAVVGAVRARNWTPTPCRILSSSIESHAGDDNTTYAIRVRYRYSVNGRQYESSRYQFLTGSSSGYAAKAAALSRLKPHATVTCYVNPADPSQAVIVRTVTPDMLFGLIPVLFTLIGVAGVAGTAVVATRAKHPPPVVPVMSENRSPVRLRAAHNRLRNFFGLFGFTLFVTVVISIFVSDCISGWRAGHPDYFLTVFIIPFVLVDLLLYVGLVTMVVSAVVSPRATVTLSPLPLVPGRAATLNWRLSGPRSGRITRLQLVLKGTEVALARNNQTPAKSVFATLPIADVIAPERIRSDETSFTLPADTMHSVTMPTSKIAWAVDVTADFAKGKSLTFSYPILIAQAVGSDEGAISVERPGASRSGRLAVQLDRNAWGPGAEVTGVASWSWDKPGEGLELRLFFHTAGVAPPDVRVLKVVPIECTEASGSRRFSFVLPAGPWSFDGELVKIAWAVELVDVSQGTCARAEFRVAYPSAAVSAASAIAISSVPA